MADQFQVDLRLVPQIKKKSNYTVWVIPRVRLGGVMVTSDHLHNTWKRVRTGTKSPEEGKFHPSTRSRATIPAPIREFLSTLDDRDTPGRVLYHGCGRDEPGLEALSREGRDEVVGYDPYHTDSSKSARPEGQFDEVFSIYTLNVVPPEVGIPLLGEMFDYLKPNGKAIIAVRDDL